MHYRAYSDSAQNRKTLGSQSESSITTLKNTGELSVMGEDPSQLSAPVGSLEPILIHRESSTAPRLISSLTYWSRLVALLQKINVNNSWKSPIFNRMNWFGFLMTVGSMSCLLPRIGSKQGLIRFRSFLDCWSQAQVIHCNIVVNVPPVQLTCFLGSVTTDWRHNFHSHTHLDWCQIFLLAPNECDFGWVSPRCCSVSSLLSSWYRGTNFSFWLRFRKLKI